MRRPDAEVEVDAALVCRLLAAQCPELAGLPLERLAEGWDNILYRAGDELIVRLPRRRVAADLVSDEQRWLPEFAQRLPLPIPVPLHAGRPAAGYPWCWSVVPWLPGTPLADEALAAGEGARLGAFIAALHVAAPEEAPYNPHRSGPLSDRIAAFEERWSALREQLDGRLETLWQRGLDAPAWQARTWIHGDLHPLNVLCSKGRLSGVIDFGDLAAGDPAVDLIAAWMAFESRPEREALLDASGADAAAVDRGRAWAVLMGLLFLQVGLTGDGRFERIGRATLRRVLEGP